ncbi:MAG: divalent-cation tolerance protein CutA [Planctomycetota bacterium]
MSSPKSAAAFLLVETTCNDPRVLTKIAEHLVDERLAACVQISGPVQSVYRWEGKIEAAEEWLLRAKTRAGLWEAIVGAIKKLHPYEVPELIATPLTEIDLEYQRWMDEALRS